MRIGLFSDTYRPIVNGITYTLDILRDEFEAQGHEVYIFAPAPQLRKYKDVSPNIVRFPAIKDIFFDGQLTSVFFPPNAVKKIKSYNLDVIHFFTPTQIGLLGAYAAIKHDIPLVTTYYTDMYEYVTHYPQVLPGLLALTLTAPLALKTKGKELKDYFSVMKPRKNSTEWNQQTVVAMLTMLHNRCDAVIVPSYKMEQQLLSWGTESRIELLPTGVNILPSDAVGAQRFRTEYGIDAGAKLVLYAGRLGSEKNIELLLRASVEVFEQVKNAKVVIVGDHEHRTRLEVLARELGVADRTIFTGFIDRAMLGNVYAAVDLFVFPSLTDTQGLVLHEAAAAGLPIVMTDPAISEVVKDGVNGYITGNDVSEFAGKIVVILDDQDLAQRMSAESKKLVAHFSAAKQAERHLAIYESLNV